MPLHTIPLVLIYIHIWNQSVSGINRYRPIVLCGSRMTVLRETPSGIRSLSAEGCAVASLVAMVWQHCPCGRVVETAAGLADLAPCSHNVQHHLPTAHNASAASWGPRFLLTTKLTTGQCVKQVSLFVLRGVYLATLHCVYMQKIETLFTRIRS